MAHCKNASRNAKQCEQKMPTALVDNIGDAPFSARASKRHEAMPLFARKPRISSPFLAANLWSCEEGRLRPACGCSG